MKKRTRPFGQLILSLSLTLTAGSLLAHHPEATVLGHTADFLYNVEHQDSDVVVERLNSELEQCSSLNSSEQAQLLNFDNKILLSPAKNVDNEAEQTTKVGKFVDGIFWNYRHDFLTGSQQDESSPVAKTAALVLRVTHFDTKPGEIGMHITEITSIEDGNIRTTLTQKNFTIMETGDDSLEESASYHYRVVCLAEPVELSKIQVKAFGTLRTSAPGRGTRSSLGMFAIPSQPVPQVQVQD